MDRRAFLKTAGNSTMVMALTGCMHSVHSQSGQIGQPPNIVLVFPDQMRGQAMGFLGQEPVLTPNLDRFAGQSLVLPQTVSNYPVCSPFRAMLMTGKYPHANYVISNCNTESAPFNCQLQESERCWSDILKDKGYSLGYIGKWHLDSPHKPYIKCSNNSETFAWNEWCPPGRRHGFDFWYAYGTYDRHTRPMYWKTDAGREAFHYVNQWGPEHEADLAIQYIANENGRFRDSNKPFALVVSMNPPHMPYNLVPQRYVDQYQDKTLEELCLRPNIPPAEKKFGKYYRDHIRHYYAMITGVDEQFGRILNTLKEKGLEDNTIVVFTSDHGNCLGIHDMIAKNNHYEESMRIPFLIRWPGKIQPRQDDLLFSSLDICPTLLDLAGCKQDILNDVDGISYAGQFMDTQGKRPEWQWYMWVPPGKPQRGRRGLRNQHYTFVISKAEGKPQEIYLYDNVADPYQMENIADSDPQLVAKLTNTLKKVLTQYRDPWIQDIS
ncbi:MAG: sulfatase [Sedimentisphaerales bacterium]|nr:sulfatase [Sedimentisphaerales bacterium]